MKVKSGSTFEGIFKTLSSKVNTLLISFLRMLANRFNEVYTLVVLKYLALFYIETLHTGSILSPQTSQSLLKQPVTVRCQE